MKREKELKDVGFDIIRFSEEQIKNDIGGVKECIMQKLNQSRA